MNRTELKKYLFELGIHPSLYSLNGDLEPDRIILYQNYNNWEVFYFSERGDRENQKIFNTESEACDYIFEHFKNQIKLINKFNLRN